MTPGIPGADPGATNAADIEEELLIQIQGYLDCVANKVAPTPELAETWDSFFLAYSPLIRAYVAVHRLAEADRVDCVQEVWGEIVARLPRFRLDPSRALFRTWLRTLARNKAVDAIRRRVRHPVESLSVADEAAIRDGRDLDPALLFERHLVQSKVRDVLEELSRHVSPSSFRAVYLLWIDGLTVLEVADALGLTPEQIRSRHHRVKRVLRRLLEQAIPEAGRPQNRAATSGRDPGKNAEKTRNAATRRRE